MPLTIPSVRLCARGVRGRLEKIFSRCRFSQLDLRRCRPTAATPTPPARERKVRRFTTNPRLRSWEGNQDRGPNVTATTVTHAAVGRVRPPGPGAADDGAMVA